MMIRCAVIDDEPLARECLVNYIEKIDFLDFIGEGSDPMALCVIEKSNPLDLIFMDIQMPTMTGIEYLRTTKVRPMVILTTAYPSYALEGFELDVLDYMVKPITFDRFFKGVNKAKDYFLLSNDSKISNDSVSIADYFFVKCEHIYEKIIIKEIEYVQALQNYIVIRTTKKKYMTLMPIKRIEALLSTYGFRRVHKSYIVALDKIQRLERGQLHLTIETIPLSRNYKDAVLQYVKEHALFKK